MDSTITIEDVGWHEQEILTQEERDALDEQTRRDGYGFSAARLRRFLTQHQKARRDGDIKLAAKISYRLGACNFHSFYGKLAKGNYDAAAAEIDSLWDDSAVSAEEEAKPACMAGFKKWLEGVDGGAFHYHIGEAYYTLIRVAKNEDFDYLYDQRRFQFATIRFDDNFGYAGIYCKRDGKVYDWQRDIGELEASGIVNGFDPSTWKSQLQEDVRGAVESAIGNDRANLRVTEVTDEREVKRLLEFQTCSAPRLARNHYICGGEEVDEEDGGGGGYVFTYECGYEPKTWTEDSLLDYILNPADYTSREVTAYLDSHQTRILADFLEGDMIAAEYAIIMANPQNPVHIVNKIMRAMRGLSAKTVNVTVRKDGAELTFKADAYQFREDCGSSYSNYLIAAADRRLFERTFGRHADYGPADITRITYARKIIFEAVR